MNHPTVRHSFFFAFAFAFCLSAEAQWYPEGLLSSPALVAADSNRFALRADVCGFFINNEYFSPVAVGQTSPGAAVTLAPSYQLSDKFNVELGVFGVKFSGRDKLSLVQPFVRLQYAPRPEFNIVFGNIYGGVNHRLIEPLYQWERHLVVRPESGLQLRWQSQRLFADVWVDWQRFIERGDDFPEELTFGLSSDIKLSKNDNRLQIAIPLQLTIHHSGGQIDVSDEPMIVVGNAATGICSSLRLGQGRPKHIGLDIYAVGYYDKLPNVTRRLSDKGWGLYPVLHFDRQPFKLMVGYWFADKYYSFSGHPLFGSLNSFDPSILLKLRDVLTAKFIFEKTVLRWVSIGAQLETYTDIRLGQTDYSFGVYLRFNGRWTTGKL